MIYIASPYSHEDSYIREQRFNTVQSFVAECLKNGNTVFSPIVHCHDLAMKHDLPADFKFWKEHCLKYLDACDAMVVLNIDGWRESKGVLAEIEYCTKNKIPYEVLS